jgi:hypothetical protein
VWPGEIPPGWELEWVEDDYRKHHGWPPVVSPLPLVISTAFETLNYLIMVKTMVCNN